MVAEVGEVKVARLTKQSHDRKTPVRQRVTKQLPVRKKRGLIIKTPRQMGIVTSLTQCLSHFRLEEYKRQVEVRSTSDGRLDCSRISSKQNQRICYLNSDHVTSHRWHTHLIDVFVGGVMLLPDDRLVFVEECLYSGQHRFEHWETQTEFLAREQRKRLGHFKLLKKQ